MNIAFYNGVSGMISYQRDMDIISNNMANVNTIGFKMQKSSFSDLLYTNLDVHNNDDSKVTGHGTRVNTINLMYEPGNFEYTSNSLDFAIDGKGLFGIETSNGDIEYTRNGAFDISVEGKTGYLVTGNGGYVLDTKSRPIKLTREDEGVAFDVSDVHERLGIFVAPNPYGLIPTGGSAFKESENSGDVRVMRSGRGVKTNKIIQGAVERSNVELADEMMAIMQTQRAFQLNSKVVKVSDEVEEMVNNLR